MSIADLRTLAQRRFVATWTQRATVVRPSGTPTFDDGTGLYTDPATTIATGVACSLVSRVSQTDVDVAGDFQTQATFELRYDPSVRLQVDDRVTFTVHDDATVVGSTVHVVAVGEAYEHIYGVASVSRTEPDAGA